MSRPFQDQTQSTVRMSVLLGILMLSLALASQNYMKARFTNYYYPETQVANFTDIVLQAIPTQVKSFLAGVFRLTADEYMHIGPTKKAKQNFIAGSFAGNTEIMSLLELSVMLEPTNMGMYAVMSHNLAIYLRRFDDAIELLHRGILANKNSPELHKLYAAAAYCYGFSRKPSFASRDEVKEFRGIAVNYLDAAINSYLANKHRLTPEMTDDFANLQNYYILKSRFLSDIGKRKEAMATWKMVPPDRQISYLGHFFTMLQQNETAMPDFPDDLLTPAYNGLFQTSTIVPPYGAPAAYRFWLVDSRNLYNLAIYSRGFGAISLLEKDCPQHHETSQTSIDGSAEPFGEVTGCGHEHENEIPENTAVSPEHLCGPECEHHHEQAANHEHHHEDHEGCPHCASARSWKQAGNSVMLQGIVMLTAAILIKKYF
ncbi:MAG: hypothetical protein ACD_39C02090G0006 [uncultured bacterium]|nr:MAG: hypothetical protein ACD_39C02090G0006 [uncultured bacterium]